MDAIELFAAQLLLSLLLSIAVLLRLQSLLRRIGGQVCERGGVATEFAARARIRRSRARPCQRPGRGPRPAGG